MTGPLVIDGAHGEGGGQILRTSLSLAALTGRPVRFERIRAARRVPGLAAQHLTAVRAAAALCDARLEGDRLGSQALEFVPRRAVASGAYTFDVSLAREGGSAGSAPLVLQTVLLPLALAAGESRLTLRGGTHLPWSPSFDFVRDVWLPTLDRLGIRATVALGAWGWYPAGGGEIRAVIEGPPRGGAVAASELTGRGPLRRIFGRAVAANLPAHVAQRMAARAGALLADAAAPVEIRAERVAAACPGAGIFLTAEYEAARAGFTALGARGRPAEAVAEEACAALRAHRVSGAALDLHMGDQILLPLCVAEGPSRYTVERATPHLETNAWVVEQFGIARVALGRAGLGGACEVTVAPAPRPGR